MTEKFGNHGCSSVAGLHYRIDPLMRIDIEEVEVPIRQQRLLCCSRPLRLRAATWKVAGVWCVGRT